MAVYVDPLREWGWRLRGEQTASCHLFSDGEDEELHQFAKALGLKREWFQPHRVCAHYDLTPARRAQAVALGAKEVSFRDAHRIWQQKTSARSGGLN